MYNMHNMYNMYNIHKGYVTCIQSFQPQPPFDGTLESRRRPGGSCQIYKQTSKLVVREMR